MKANCYKDDGGEVPDPMKPVLDRMVDMVVASLSGKAKDFYDREFGFFNEVTSISGKLKPFIKKSKPEKKAKIDEEMANIEVSVGVYLPSNPDGVVVELDKKSGRPLQSHAKVGGPKNLDSAPRN
jgi:phosphatidylinositol 4-kinase